MLSSPVFGSNPLKSEAANTSSTNSTNLIYTSLNLAQEDDCVEYKKENPAVFREEDIPKHFNNAAKSLIKQLIDSHLYSFVSITTDTTSWVSKVQPFTLKFHQDHPTVIGMEGKAFVFNEIYTNINFDGKVTYQIETWNGTLLYIDANRIPYNEVKLNHLKIVMPHLLLQILEEETEKQQKGGSGSLSLRKSF